MASDELVGERLEVGGRRQDRVAEGDEDVNELEHAQPHLGHAALAEDVVVAEEGGGAHGRSWEIAGIMGEGNPKGAAAFT